MSYIQDDTNREKIIVDIDPEDQIKDDSTAQRRNVFKISGIVRNGLLLVVLIFFSVLNDYRAMVIIFPVLFLIGYVAKFLFRERIENFKKKRLIWLYRIPYLHLYIIGFLLVLYQFVIIPLFNRIG